MMAFAVLTAAGLLAGSNALDWHVKAQVAGYNMSCSEAGGKCGNGAVCCEELACAPVENQETYVVEARCVVPDRSQQDGDKCYAIKAKCSFSHQCCSGLCDTDVTWSCVTPPPTTASPTREPYDYYGYDDEGGVNFAGRQDEASPHWGAVGGSVPLGAILIIAAALVGVAVVVVPRVLHNRRLAALGVDALPPSPANPDDEWSSSGGASTAGYAGVSVLRGWRTSLLRHAGPEFEGYQPLDADPAPKVPTRDYEEIEEVEINEMVNQASEPHTASY